MIDRTRARQLAAEYNQKGEPTAWFEQLYQEAEEGKSVVPWADLVPNPHLLNFWKDYPQEALGKPALIVGCGLGDDAEQLAYWGYRATAFDIAPTAVSQARKRFPESPVDYVVGDLLAPPGSWFEKFDFVFECYTLQALPVSLRRAAIGNLAKFLRPGGRLLVIARGREESEAEGEMPWPVTKNELQQFAKHELEQTVFEDVADYAEPGVRRFIALYQRR
jgi:SAM-dependent methyltransferase